MSLPRSSARVASRVSSSGSAGAGFPAILAAGLLTFCVWVAGQGCSSDGKPFEDMGGGTDATSDAPGSGDTGEPDRPGPGDGGPDGTVTPDVPIGPDGVGPDGPAPDMPEPDVPVLMTSDAGPLPDAPPLDLTATGPCDPLNQATCPTSQACSVQGGALGCIAAGTGGADTSCGSGDNNGCAAGFVCATAPTGGAPLCRTICSVQDPQCPSGQDCTGELPGFNRQRERLCIPNADCDILADNACGANQKCDLSGTPPRTICYPDGTVDNGGSCQNASCKSGLVCTILNGGPPTCRPVCDPTAANRRPCASGSCLQFNEYPGIGFCG